MDFTHLFEIWLILQYFADGDPAVCYQWMFSWLLQTDMIYFELFSIVYLSFFYKVLQDLQQTLEIEIYSQSKNELKVENLDEKGKTSSRFLEIKLKTNQKL